jgi:hypothetical protein
MEFTLALGGAVALLLLAFVLSIADSTDKNRHVIVTRQIASASARRKQRAGPDEDELDEYAPRARDIVRYPPALFARTSRDRDLGADILPGELARRR